MSENLWDIVELYLLSNTKCIIVVNRGTLTALGDQTAKLRLQTKDGCYEL